MFVVIDTHVYYYVLCTIVYKHVHTDKHTHTCTHAHIRTYIHTQTHRLANLSNICLINTQAMVAKQYRQDWELLTRVEKYSDSTLMFVLLGICLLLCLVLT